MWGNIILEVSFITNFHLGFNNTRSDVLLHLTQWQYWWWFWFTFVWGLYFLIFMRIFRMRTLKFKPRIVTSFRPHGKWGDIIVCLLPVSWCANIISNSSLILRMIEWQAESSLFTLRIRGRQWYWIYKYDFKSVTDFMTAPKNLGHNKWRISTPNDLQISDDYLQILQLRAHNKWIRRYWTEFLDKTLKEDNFNILSLQENNSLEKYTTQKITTNFLNSELFFNQEENYNNINLFNTTKINFDSFNDYVLNKRIKKGWRVIDDLTETFPTSTTVLNDDLFLNNSKLFKKKIKNTQKLLSANFLFNGIENTNTNLKNLFNHDIYNEVTRWTKRSQGTISPLRIIKFPLINEIESSSLENLNLLRLRFNDENSTLIHKPYSGNNFLILKQKRYKPLKAVTPWMKYVRDAKTGKKTTKIKSTRSMTLWNNSLFINDTQNQTLKYKILKKSKIKSEDMPLVFWKRLLRTKRTLILPAHINIAVITNSYDIIHSWFIPGLGLKLDCIPGRATHHVMHIDNVGFYYGQCAEICGRYHHHMPIRICALPFEHFLLWWHTFGLSKLMYLRNDRQRFTKNYALRKYVW